MLVQYVMTRRAETIGPDQSLQAAARKMREVDIGVLVVCDDDRPIGILTDRDIVVRSTAAGQAPAAAAVRSAMTPQVIACAEGQDLAAAAELMQEHAVRRVAVLDPDDKVVGVLSVDDLALFSRSLAGEVIEHARAPDRPTRIAWPWWE